MIINPFNKLFIKVANEDYSDKSAYNYPVDRQSQEFIDGYLSIRNSIINLYETELQYISFKAVLKFQNYQLVYKIFNFLEDNRLINFNTDLSGLLDKLAINDDITDTVANEYKDNCIKSFSKPSSSLYINNNSRRIKEKYFVKDEIANINCECGTRSQCFTSNLFFCCQVCLELFKYPAKYSIRNFHKITDELLNSIWAKQEEYLLLKKIEEHGDQWNKVGHNLNKTVEQCIFHFIKMSIIDDLSSFPTIPFTQVPNPISTLIAFLCSMVHPYISDELAKSAIKNLNFPCLMEALHSKSRDKSIKIIKNENNKLEKLKKVELEAMIKRFLLKVDSINEINAEIQAIRHNLENERERLLEEFAKNN